MLRKSAYPYLASGLMSNATYTMIYVMQRAIMPNILPDNIVIEGQECRSIAQELA